MASKTAKKSSPQLKNTGGFQASGEVPRIVPLRGDKVYFLNPKNGRTEHLTHEQAAARLEEFADHPLYENMLRDLKQATCP